MINHEPEPAVDLFKPYIYSSTALALDGLLKMTGNYEIEAWEKLPDGHAGILAPNHAGVLDIPLLGAATRHVYGRSIRFIAKDGLVKNYRHSDKVRSYFNSMGGIIFDQSLPMSEQPAGPQIMRDIANDQLVCSFNQKGVVPGREITGKTRSIGPLAVKTLTPVQPVGMAGTEGNLSAWMGPKAVVYGKVMTPEPDMASFNPDNPRTWARYARTFSDEVDAMTQAATHRAHQLQSRKIISFSGRHR